MVQLIKKKKKKAQINAISTLSNLIAELYLRTKWHVTWHLHVISARCVARDLHTIAPGPLERTCWRQFAALWGDGNKSRIAPLNAIIIILNPVRLPLSPRGQSHTHHIILGTLLVTVPAALCSRASARHRLTVCGARNGCSVPVYCHWMR